MTPTVEAVVRQVIEYDDVDRYAMPNVAPHVEPGEAVALLVEDPIDGWLARLTDPPVVGHLIAIGWALVAAMFGVPTRRDIEGWHVAAVPSGSVVEGERITVDLDEAVVEETRTRSGVDDREIWLYEGTVRDRGDHS